MAEAFANSPRAMDLNRDGKFLIFSLAGEEFGIGILNVKEIIGLLPITALPCLPEFMKGAINLLAKVIPVIDLRCKFDMEEVPYSERTCIIVSEIKGIADSIHVGIVVDSVPEVLDQSDPNDQAAFRE